MTFEEYAQKHLGDAGYSFSAMELVRMGWNARGRHGSCQGMLDSSGGELKPCPFCGTKAEIKGGLEAQENYSVWCENLHHMDGGYDREKLVAQWNKRAMPEITPAMIEAGAKRLVRWEDDCVWPDSWRNIDIAAAKQDSERVIRSALSVMGGDGEPA